MPISIPKCDHYMDIECKGNVKFAFKRAVLIRINKFVQI
jgi:hypothetical protein